eukprot:m.28829 g.28829  ORF g.28829 m.28829 type:complete len:373 (-) comp8955_c0_seq1:23-1141(-)
MSAEAQATQRKRPFVLVTNDDGYDSKGIKALSLALAEFADVLIVAPATNQSAKSMCLTLGAPLKVVEQENIDGLIGRWSVSGSPVDSCVMGMHVVIEKLGRGVPDLVVSGINHGANLGGDVLVSGTVGAAMYASLHYRVPAVASSLVFRTAATQPELPGGKKIKEPLHFERVAEFTAAVCRQVVTSGDDLLPGTILNINVPNHLEGDLASVAPPPTEYAITVPGVVHYRAPLVEPGKESGEWVCTGTPEFAWLPGSDCHAVAEGVMSVTPLSVRGAPTLKFATDDGRREPAVPPSRLPSPGGYTFAAGDLPPVRPAGLHCAHGVTWLAAQTLPFRLTSVTTEAKDGHNPTWLTTILLCAATAAIATICAKRL